MHNSLDTDGNCQIFPDHNWLIKSTETIWSDELKIILNDFKWCSSRLTASACVFPSAKMPTTVPVSTGVILGQITNMQNPNYRTNPKLVYLFITKSAKITVNCLLAHLALGCVSPGHMMLAPLSTNLMAPLSTCCCEENNGTNILNKDTFRK